ncbi:hypothetical protein T439DRAFT_309154 [Meredithblackwellia eburnea MCA 4105]
MTILYIGNIKPTSEGVIIPYESLENGKFPPGGFVKRWDYIGQVTSASLSPDELAPWRRKADPLADSVVEALDLGPGRDGLKAVLEEVEKEDGDESAKALWRSMSEGRNDVPNKGQSAEEYRQLLMEGQDVFWRYSAQFFGALMHFSLAGGFSSPNLSGVLRETGYLTSASKDATYKRLLETTIFVIDAMKDLTPVTGRGFKSALRVRLLHAQVRRKILLGKGREKCYDSETWGLPINQVDLATVLGSFMIAPLWSMRRMRFKVSERECLAYQTVWTHIGFWLGVDPVLLDRVYGSSFSSAEIAFASLAFSAFPTTRPDCDPTQTPTYKMLASVAGRPPRTHSTVGYHVEYCRLLLGPLLADHLALPRGTWRDRLSLKFDVWSGWLLVEFGRWWRKGWQRERMELTGEIIELLVVWGLGERRSVFSWREEKDWAEKLRVEESEEPGLKMGKEVGIRVRQRWRALLIEMGVILAIAGFVVVVDVYQFFLWWYLFKHK